jgi:hypothetical protein
MAISIKPKKYDSTAAKPVREYETATKPIREYQESDWIDVVDEGIGSSGLPDKTRRQALRNTLEPWMRDKYSRELGFHHLVGDDPDARRFVFLKSPLQDEPRVGHQIRGMFSPPREKVGLDESRIRLKIIDAIERGESPFHSAGLTQPGERYEPGELPLGGGIASLGPGAFTHKPVGFYSPDEIPISLQARQEAGLPPGYSVGWTKGMETAGHEMDHSGLAALRAYLLNKDAWMNEDRARYASIPTQGGPEEEYVKALQATDRPMPVARRPVQKEAEEAALKAYPKPSQHSAQGQALEMLRQHFAGRRLYPPRRLNQRQAAR